MNLINYNIKRLTMDLINLLKESLIYDFTNSESLLKIMQLDEVHDFVKKASMQHRFLMIDALMDAYDKYRNAASILFSIVSRETLTPFEALSFLNPPWSFETL